MKTQRRTAIVADDHALMRSGLVQLLTDHARMDVVAEAEDGLTAIAVAKKHRPHLMTLDIAMPYAQGLAVYTEIKRWSPETKVVVFTGVTSSTLLRDLVDAGVHGVFTKRGDIDEFQRAIPHIMNGSKVISPDAVSLLEATRDRPDLTQRERQILNLICAGQTTKMVAETLSVSVKTIDNHRTNLMSKLGVSSLGELLAHAVREGLLDAHHEL